MIKLNKPFIIDFEVLGDGERCVGHLVEQFLFGEVFQPEGFVALVELLERLAVLAVHALGGVEQFGDVLLQGCRKVVGTSSHPPQGGFVVQLVIRHLQNDVAPFVGNVEYFLLHLFERLAHKVGKARVAVEILHDGAVEVLLNCVQPVEVEQIGQLYPVVVLLQLWQNANAVFGCFLLC